MKKIIINAIAARTSGALSIVKSFVDFIDSREYPNTNFLLLTSTNGIFKKSAKLNVFELPHQNWWNRIQWDKKAFQTWCKKNDIIPDVVISFQNTCSHFNQEYINVKQLVYYHQLIPLVKYNWSLLRKDEQKLFLYAHFYGYFVNRWNNNAEYVVQLPSVKKLFCKKFTNINTDSVHIIRPNLPSIDISSVPEKQMYEGKKLFIYPATPLRYKNHTVILRALDYLTKSNPGLTGRIKVIFTVPTNSFVAKSVQKLGLDSVVECTENIPYEELLSYYKCSDALLFPSKIESFGLPLIEAALFGIPVIASELPYAREVLENYSNAVFINSDDFVSWATAIKEVCMNEKQLKPMIKENKDTWEQFEQLMLSQ
ncbi:MAG: glycosyltransferase [Lachnospiraceae bacterium]|nr:glycosyltransferase [Lachnospiraceae bacterium]